MEYRRLGRTNLNVSLLGLGSGGRSKLGQAYGQDQAAVTRVVRGALEIGVNFVDTAPAYDRAEELLGRALEGFPRDRYVLCTKMLPVQDDVLQSPDALRTSLEASLRRLRTDYVDVFYLHAVHPDWADQVIERFREPLERARRDGLIRFSGVTEAFQTDHNHLALRTLLPLGLFDVAMVGYNVLSPAPAQHVFPLAQAGDVGVVVMCAVRGVLLDPQRIRAVVGEWKAAGLLAWEPVADADPLGWLLGPWASSMAEVGYKFAAAHPAVSTVLTGTGRLEHLQANAQAILGTPLPATLVEGARALFAPVSRNASF